MTDANPARNTEGVEDTIELAIDQAENLKAMVAEEYPEYAKMLGTIQKTLRVAIKQAKQAAQSN